MFDTPTGVAVSKSGKVYVTDTNNHRVRKVERDETTGAWITDTYAGCGEARVVDGAKATACFLYPSQARALPPLARVRMGLTESSTASAVAPSAALLDRARAHAARDTTDRVARTKSRILAQFLPTQPRPPGATGLFTALTVALSVVLTQ